MPTQFPPQAITRIACSLLCLFAFSTQRLVAAEPSTAVTVVRLRCEHLENPLVIDRPRPRLSWQLHHDGRQRDIRQTAYRVLVARSADALAEGRAELWDSGVVESDRSVAVPYGGEALRYGDRCFWKVQVRLGSDQWTAWSSVARWTVGPLAAADWAAKWIGCDQQHRVVSEAPPEGEFLADPWLRKKVPLDELPEQAIVQVASIGYHELHVNGRKVTDAVLQPGVADHSQRARYVTYDITEHLQEGENAIGLWLGAGWSVYRGYRTPDRPNTPLVLGQAEFYFADGRRQQIATDESWKTHPSPNALLGEWVFRDFGGEFYDGMQEAGDWSEPSLDDSRWDAVRVYPLDVEVSAESIEPNRAVTTVVPQQVTEVADKTYRIDMGKNYAGLLEITLHGNPGDVVTLEWSEREDQRITHALRSAYRIGPSGEGTFRNRFNYGSGRWLTVSNVAEPPELDEVRGYVVRNDYRRIGQFECSDELLNEIYDVTCWTFENLSLGGYVVDCPQRERMGYGGDAHATTPMAVHTYDLAAFYAKWCQDWRDVQGHQSAWGGGDDADTRTAAHEGDLPYTAPTYWGGGGPIWCGICVTLPWYTYRHYGDPTVLEDNFAMIEKWLTFLETKAEDDLLQRWGGEWDFLGDWVWPGAEGVNGDTPESLFLNNCNWVYNLETAAKVADALDRPQQASQWRRRADEVRQAIHRRFYNDQEPGYVSNMQACLAIALLVDIPPDDIRPLIEQRLEEEILIHRDGHFWGGITGGYFIFKHLLESRRNDLAFTMVSQTDYPGWGDMLRQGATTLWETWEGHLSRLHSSYLHVGGWFPEGLVGIVPDERHPGYKHFFVRPGFNASSDLDWAEASYDSPYGLIEVHWQQTASGLEVDVTVPPNSSATVCLPADDDQSVTEAGEPLGDRPGVRRTTRTDDELRCTIGSGTYHFAVQANAISGSGREP